jgi:hypothetical protein
MTKSERKNLITKKILEIIRPDYNEAMLNKLQKLWWKSNRSDSGFRLSDMGFKAFNLAEIESWSYEISRYVVGNYLLDLDRYIDCPYAIEANNKTLHLHIYDSKIAVMINLYQGVDPYINSFKK